MVHNGSSAWVVDPGVAAPVQETLDRLSLKLDGILVTHHHGDHTGAVQELLARHPQACAWGPAGEARAENITPLHDGDRLDGLDLHWQVLALPGHTLSHIGFLAASNDHTQPGILFCGDTLFSGGCGRIFEGTPAQMKTSLDRLAALPAQTRVCCAHEYTLGNLRFARKVDPDNTELIAHEQRCIEWRAQGRPTLPSTLGRERSINPFLRCDTEAVRSSVMARSGCAPDALSVFTALREWKNND